MERETKRGTIIPAVITGILGIVGAVLGAIISNQVYEKSLLIDAEKIISQPNTFATKQDLLTWMDHIYLENKMLNSRVESVEEELEKVSDMVEQIKAIPLMTPGNGENNSNIGHSIVELSENKFAEQLKETEDESYTNNDFFVELKVRLVGDPDLTWKDSVDAKVGDRVEFQMQYRNLSDTRHPSVAVRNVLPDGLRYVEGSTYLYNTLHQNGAHINEDDIINNGVNIGNYLSGANAYVRITAEVVNDDGKEGPYLLVNWAQGQAGADIEEQYVLQDYATVRVNYNFPENN